MVNSNHRNHSDNPMVNNPAQMDNHRQHHIGGKASNPCKNSQVRTTGSKLHPSNRLN